MAAFEVSVEGARVALYPGSRGTLRALVLGSDGREVASISIHAEDPSVPVTHVAALNYADAIGVDDID